LVSDIRTVFSQKKMVAMEVPPERLNAPSPSTINLLLTRRSGSAKAMKGPGPDAAQLEQILCAAIRVPDHGKLAPWRFIIFQGEARERMGAILAEAVMGERDASPERAETERKRFLRAPTVIGVVSRVREGFAIPAWEQQMSAGAACMNILIAATSLGFVANLLTEWYAYHPVVLERLGLKQGERIAGFIYVGKAAVPLEDRRRPDLDALVTQF
jgi:nitroreductase